MIVIQTVAHITAEQPYIKITGVPEGNYEVVVVLQPIEDEPEKIPRLAGFGKGKIEISEDFTEPLDDFKEYMK